MVTYSGTLPDGRSVELIDMTLGGRDGDLWKIDVHFMVDGHAVTKRVELIWSEGSDDPPRSP